MQLAQFDVVIFGGGMQFNRDIDQTEADAAFPNGVHDDNLLQMKSFRVVCEIQFILYMNGVSGFEAYADDRDHRITRRRRLVV
ncbi:hypothetical protein NCCP2331_22410 [Sporosarcina sp. NCCP-2331]|nr:hypothetical protein NCCP2331_22410 [Sporosarcina sp. NCCP-2331]